MAGPVRRLVAEVGRPAADRRGAGGRRAGGGSGQRDRRGRRRGEGGGGVGDAGRAGRAAAAARRDRRPDDLLPHADRRRSRRGDPVVLVHGFGGDKNSWLFVQQPLAEDHAVHALDLPGHGASDKDVGDGSLAALADTVVGFLDALGISRAHLVGHSLGGAVVAAVARATPGRVASLTLLAPAGYTADADAEYLRGFAAARHPAGAQAAGRAAVRGPRAGHPPAGRRPAALQAARRGRQGPVRAARHAARRRPPGDRHPRRCSRASTCR